MGHGKAKTKQSDRLGAGSRCVTLCFSTIKKDRKKIIIPFYYWEHAMENL